MTKEQEIIVRWIEGYKALELKDHLKAAWIIRDIIDGMKWVTPDSIEFSIKFLKGLTPKKEKAAAERDYLVAVLSRGRTADAPSGNQPAENRVQFPAGEQKFAF